MEPRVLLRPRLRHNIEKANAMPRKLSLLGKTFGRLKVVSDGPKIINRLNSQSSSVCLCLCGNTCTVRNSNLRKGTSNSCGCLQKELLVQRSIRHGHSKRGLVTRTYNVWIGMIKRCLNPGNSRYCDYGARGITICERWLDFNSFLSDMGSAPPGLSLGRKNNNGNYEPINCEWQTPMVQNRNKRTNVIVKVGGFRGCLSEAAERFGINMATARKRMQQMGWSAEKAFTTPLLHKRQ